MDGVNDRAAETAKGLQDAFTIGNVAAVARDHPDQRSAVGTMKKRGIGSEFVGSGLHEVTEVPDHIDGNIARVEEEAAQNCVYRVGLELERCDHAEVPASAAKSPEEILVLRGIGREHFAVGSDQLARQQIVDRHAVFAKQPTDTAAQRETRNTGLRDDAGGDRKTEDVRFAVEIAKRRAALNANRTICRIHVDGTHAGKVYDDTVIAKCAAAHIVTAAANRRQQIIRPSKVDSGNDVSDA